MDFAGEASLPFVDCPAAIPSTQAVMIRFHDRARISKAESENRRSSERKLG
jgi:hypothetical protein